MGFPSRMAGGKSAVESVSSAIFWGFDKLIILLFHTHLPRRRKSGRGSFI